MTQNEEWNNWGNLGEVGDIRFYIDDEIAPRLSFSIKDLFVGKGSFPAPLAAFYASANGGNINYVPVPFQKSIRITTTGRPRMMQIQVKRFAADALKNLGGTPINRVRATDIQSFSATPSFSEQIALNRAAQAWQACAPSNLPEFKTYQLAIPNNQARRIEFRSARHNCRVACARPAWHGRFGVDANFLGWRTAPESKRAAPRNV